MEALFQTTLSPNEKSISYDVHFEEETYVFKSAQSDAPLIRLKREEDEWHGAEEIDPFLRTAAISALERYLLAQH